MRLALVVACLLLLAAAASRGVVADDKPSAPIAVQEDAVGALVRGLLAADGPERAKAESALARADAESLRALVGRLRQRLAVEAPEPAARTLGPGKRAPGRLAAGEAEGPMVLLEMSMVEAPAATAQEIVRLGAARADGTRGYDRKALEGLLSGLLKGAKIKVLQAPSIVTGLGQVGDLTILDQTAFIQDFDIVGSHDALMADPIVGVVDSGMRVEFLAALRGEVLSVDVTLDLSALSKPISAWTGPLIKGLPDMTLQLPEVSTTRWTRRVMAPQGGPVLLTVMASPSSTIDPLAGVPRADARVLVFLEGTLLPATLLPATLLPATLLPATPLPATPLPATPLPRDGGGAVPPPAPLQPMPGEQGPGRPVPCR